MGNELVTETKDSETVQSGSRLTEGGFDLKKAFKSKSWVAGGLRTVATVSDTAAAMTDPLDEALSAGIGWIIERLGSLNEWLDELTGDSGVVVAAASTQTNITTRLNSYAGDLGTVCTEHLAGQESLAVATFKTLQVGSVSHLRMTGQLADAISGGLTVISTIVHMVRDMVRGTISDVIGKLASKVAIGVLAADLAVPWAVSTAITEISSWVARLSKEVVDTILSAKNLKGLLTGANRLFDDVATAFSRIPAKVSETVTTKVEATKSLATSLSNPQYALTDLPGISMRQAGDMGRAKPTVHRPSGGPKPPKTPRPNPSEGRWGVKLDDATSTTESTNEATDAAANGAKNTSHTTDAAVDGARGAAGAAGTAAASTKRAGSAADATKTGKNAGKYQKNIPELFRQHQAQKTAKQQAIEHLDEAVPKGYSRSDSTQKRMQDAAAEMADNDHSAREISKLEDLTDETSTTRKELNGAAARIGETDGETRLTESGYYIPEKFRTDNVAVNNETAPQGWADGMALSLNGDEIVVAEYKGVGAHVDSAPRATTYEGKTPQASPAYTRDRMLSDPRFAQYFHDHPDAQQNVRNRGAEMTIKVIAACEPGRIKVTSAPSELTPEVTQHLQNSIGKLQKAQESATNPTTSDDAGSTTSDFRYYPVGQAIGIIRAITERRWPMTVEEAFSLRDRFGWAPAPDGGRSFVAPVSNGEEDGRISLVVNNNRYISRVSFRLTSLAPPDPGPGIRALMQSARSEYVAGLTSLYGTAAPSSGSKIETLSWYLPLHTSVGLGANTRSVFATVESPAMTGLTETEEKYFAKGRELQPSRTAAPAPQPGH